MSALAPRLEKLIPLIFISDKPGEVFGAVQVLRRTIEAIGCDAYCLTDIIVSAFEPKPEPAPLEPELAPWQSTAMWCLRRADGRLTTAELDFLRNMAVAKFEPSPKQVRWLDAIFRSLGGRA
jgi:hypothetical protein